MRRTRIAVGLVLAATGPLRGGDLQIPAGFDVTLVKAGFTRPVDVEFAGDGRIFVAEQRGMVWVIENGETLATPFIDLRTEINNVWDRGLLGMTLDPGFLSNRHVYLLYTVDPIFGKPDEDPHVAAWGRLTRYTGTARSGGNEADVATRLVLLGDLPAEGIPVCDPSHTIGTLAFGFDGSLFVSAGDGAHFDNTDAGGLDPDCFEPGMFPQVEDIGAFRSQFLGSLAGKILRIDPVTGQGLSDNPHWTGSGLDNQSRVWANGLRNPFRVTVRPDSPVPGTIYAGDVGWFTFEEINVVGGGENFGWPCEEGTAAAPNYPTANPDHSGCDTIETPANPGPLTGPIIAWHHVAQNQSTPPGYTGNAAVSGVFYTGSCFPAPYDCGLFLTDHIAGWVKVLEVDGDDNFVALHDFATGVDAPVDIAAHPMTGDLHYLEIYNGQLWRISYPGAPPGDLDGDCAVSTNDLLMLLAAWGPCPGPPDDCPADLDEDGIVATNDLLILLANWT